MALQGNLTSQLSNVGFDFPEAYARVQSYRGDKDTLVILVAWFASAQARIDGKQPVLLNEYPMLVPPINGELLPAFYAHLKSLSDFEGYIDV